MLLGRTLSPWKLYSDTYEGDSSDFLDNFYFY